MLSLPAEPAYVSPMGLTIESGRVSAKEPLHLTIRLALHHGGVKPIRIGVFARLWRVTE